MGCGAGDKWFSVGAQASFSYLLPARLAAGEYTFDIGASDTSGDRTKLSRGSTRTVFYVR
jgi:hypothetical protein